uniref:Putative secreted protein n=1 Tax=Anopheles darlingi TaxID=43151 RepID=A0A2M4DKE4_ANODA
MVCSSVVLLGLTQGCRYAWSTFTRKYSSRRMFFSSFNCVNPVRTSSISWDTTSYELPEDVSLSLVNSRCGSDALLLRDIT